MPCLVTLLGPVTSIGLGHRLPWSQPRQGIDSTRCWKVSQGIYIYIYNISCSSNHSHSVVARWTGALLHWKQPSPPGCRCSIVGGLGPRWCLSNYSIRLAFQRNQGPQGMPGEHAPHQGHVRSNRMDSSNKVSRQCVGVRMTREYDGRCRLII